MRFSRRQFIATTGCAAGGALAHTVSTGAVGSRSAEAFALRSRNARSAEAFAQRSRSVTMTPALTLACSNYIRFLPIATGDVRPADLALTWVRGDRTEMLRRATDDATIDGGESSMAQHVMRLDRGERSLVAVPIFPLRNFTARDLYTRKGRTLTGATLGNRRIGIYNWGASGAVWYRHLVRYFGHDVTKISWVVGGADGPANVTVPDPPPAHVSKAPAGTSLSDLLIAGEIDVFFAPLPPRKHHPVDGPIVRVFPDFRTIEQQYFAETRCYPPQHVVLIRRASWERDRPAARRLVEAFDRSEAIFEAAQREFPYNSPWLIADVEDAARLMGADYHAHGLEKNRHAVDVFCRSAFEDGLTRRRLTTDDFFDDFLMA